MGVVAFLFIAGCFGAILWVDRQARERRRALLAELGQLLGATPRDNAVVGRLREQVVGLAFVHRGSGKSRRPWTEIDVVVPTGQLSFALREETRGQAALRDRGLVVDVLTGDELFDDAFIVEAAPADVARALLDEELRRALLAARPFAVVPSDGRLRIEVPGHITEPARAAALCDLAARLAAGYRPAHAAADAALEAAAPREGSPFRADPAGGEELRAAKRARLDEIAHLAEVKARRQRMGTLGALAIIGVIVLIYVVVMAANVR